MRLSIRLLLTLLMPLALVHCGDPDEPGPVDPGPGETRDAGTGGETDAGTGGETDAGTGGETDAGTGGETDAGTGGETDAGTGGETDAGTGGETDAGTVDYTVGGTLSGLGAGKTLKLLNNGGDELSLTANGPYTFTTPVAAGDGYNVTISAQPAGQKCTVTHGSGTISTSDVTNVDVACVTESHNVVVLRVGTGTGALSGKATPVFIETYDALSTTTRPPSNITSINGLTISGTSTAEGFLSRSSDGRYVVFGGYSESAGSDTATSNRVIGRLDAANEFVTVVMLPSTDTFGIRSVTTVDGSAYWFAGNGNTFDTGIQYVPHGAMGSPTPILSAPTNNRVVLISNGNLYVTSGSGSTTAPYKSVFSVGTGLPTTSGQTATVLPNLPNGVAPLTSPYGFFFLDRDASSPGDDTLYVADDASATGGVFKFVKDATGNWKQASLTNPGAARGVVAFLDGTTVRVVATTGTKLLTFVDDGTTTATITTLATAATNTAYRGVALAPIP
ncbi:hypothetical protein F0U61_26005 [Archangium violaceum]|uniref:hypothetical protein n=1 Tax=Archangium violaceum TaxID=83451 RepID=UPI002B2E707C|nr:hypothetical protein F0U61_26005 [Archangium violaceum]